MSEQWIKIFDPSIGLYAVDAVPTYRRVAMGLFEADADRIIADHTAARDAKNVWDRLILALFGDGIACVICNHPPSQHAFTTGTCRSCWKECPALLNTVARDLAEKGGGA